MPPADEFAAEKAGWYGPAAWDSMRVNAEVRGWLQAGAVSAR